LSDAWSIVVKWQSASSVNGPIERYMLYLSTDSQSTGSVVYNTSHLLLSHTLNNLTAATLYFIRLAVSCHALTSPLRFVLMDLMEGGHDGRRPHFPRKGHAILMY